MLLGNRPRILQCLSTNVVYETLQFLSFFPLPGKTNPLDRPCRPISKSFSVIRCLVERFLFTLYPVTNRRSLRTICLTSLVIGREYLIKPGSSFLNTLPWKLVLHDLVFLHEFSNETVNLKFDESKNVGWMRTRLILIITEYKISGKVKISIFLF